METTREWVDTLRDAFEDVRAEMGPNEDCYEQLSLMMLLAAEAPLRRSPMRNPPRSLDGFFSLQKDIAVKMVGDRAVFWDVDEDPVEEAMLNGASRPSAPLSRLDAFFRQLGLAIREGEAEAYMRDALFRGESSPDPVLARVVAGRSLLFGSAKDQEEFHRLWCALWEQIHAAYDRSADPFGPARAGFLSLNDKCVDAMRTLDQRNAGEGLLENPLFAEFNKLTLMIGSTLVLLNTAAEGPSHPAKEFEEMMESLAPAVDDLLARLLQQ
jgi:hypothetical protein